ncbi:MAG: cation/multidrug efflux pump [Casimicrobiaceae bacterium]
MLLGALVTACVLAGFLFLLLALRRLRRRRFGACALHGVSSLVLFLVAVAGGLVGVNLLTYQRLTREQPAVEARFTRTGDQRFDALLVYPSGATQRVDLRGDEWQIDARVLKWRPFANILGFDAAYRLERIGGRYADIERERSAERTVYALNPSDRIDVWTLLRTWHRYLPWVDALYGSAVYVPMSDGARYEVVVSQSGLVARPLNEVARQAVGAWK